MASHKAALQKLRKKRFFEGWDEFIDAQHVAASEASMIRLVDDLLALDSKLTEKAARKAVDKCVKRFNDLDDGWICTIEREDICEQICTVVEACGFDCEEDWLDERDW
jgi:hypothetical protein